MTTKTTLAVLKTLAKYNHDITDADNAARDAIIAREGSLEKILVSYGQNGVNGFAFVGNNTGELYIIAGRTPATQIFY